MNLQAGELKKSAAQASRLAKDAEAANRNASEAERPWIGAVFAIKNFQVGQRPEFDFTFINGGRRPAIADIMIAHASMYAAFPDPEKDYDYSGNPSTALIVPGTTQLSEGTMDGPLTQDALDALNSKRLTFYVFAKIEYRDVRDNKKHWLHSCYQYDPGATKFLSGFRQCHRYNDTDQN